MPEQDFFVMPDELPVRVAVEPAQNVIHSLLLLAKVNKVSGLGDWVVRTARALSPEERVRHRLVLIGFFYAVLPEQSWPSFPAYIDHLANLQPFDLRDKLLSSYTRMQPLCEGETEVEAAEPLPVDWKRVLKDADSYLEFLGERFGEKYVDVELETRAYSLVIDPPAMQDLIISHLRWMWDEYLATEWKQVEPMLQDAVEACRQVDLDRLSMPDAAQRITGQELKAGKWKHSLENVEQLVLVPTTHSGPYLGRLRAGSTLWIMFGARLPEGVKFDAPDLSRAEIVMRLGALADDNRLRILRLVSEEGELTSKSLMASLGLSQSATSRHLSQLSATGYLSERRCNGAKCYRLNSERIEGTLAAISSFLLGEQ